MNPEQAPVSEQDRHDTVRMIDFQRASQRRQAERVVDTPVGFAVFSNRYRHSYDHNKFVVTGGDVPTVLETAERLLAEEGLAHRYIVVHDEQLGEALAPALTESGHVHERNVLMRHDGRTPESRVTVAVDEIALDELRAPDRESWLAELPQASAEAIDHLVDRRVTRLQAAPRVAFLGVREGGQVVARADLYVDAGAGVAQIEDVHTQPAHRGRGLAGAVLATGLEHARRAGCDLVFLEASADDWPRHFYAKIGYRELAVTHLFCRVPG
ncbi:GNAT family N-acetyltransferase [Catellatospora sp. NPDC049133]|uniref:GNAT family N-acetyltransferase n=1 Tax=Catellatospora sp. NPDC049133 TaxID=3155499 RepID=UPI0033C6496E